MNNKDPTLGRNGNHLTEHIAGGLYVPAKGTLQLGISHWTTTPQSNTNIKPAIIRISQ